MLADSDLRQKKYSYIKHNLDQRGDVSSSSTDFPIITSAYILCVASASAKGCGIKQFCCVVKIASGREVRFKSELEGLEGKRRWKLWRRRFFLRGVIAVLSAWSEREVSAKQGLRSSGIFS